MSDSPKWTRREVLASGLLLGTGTTKVITPPARERSICLENDHFSIEVETATGALTSLVVKRNRSELIQENRLRSNFRICLPLPDYFCNYIDGMNQHPASVERIGDSVEVRFEEMKSPKGVYRLALTYSIVLDGDCIRFRAALKNHTEHPISEFWFPRLGGWTEFGSRGSKLATPGYWHCRHEHALFYSFPGLRDLGAEAAEMSQDYPGVTAASLSMPWWDIYDDKNDTGLYLGYHDPIFRFSSWHLYLMPEASGNTGDNWLTSAQAAGEAVGLVFSHVRFPFIKQGETFKSGEFVLRVHEGDWHQGSLFYRDWFLQRFPFDKSKSWLRKHRSWFSSIIYQPEDKIIADFETFDQWCRDAEERGIRCHELIGWDKGGLERDYPEYVPEEKLGGREGYRALQRSIKSRGARCLTFVNYNILDSSTELYKRKLNLYRQQDLFGNTPNRMAWGESTLLARKGLSVHRHVLSSVIAPIRELLEGYFLDLVKDGADGFQVDKIVASRGLDFNPLNTYKPDEVLCEGLVEAVGELLAKCRRLNPDFCLASEHSQDRFIPFVDVAYRACAGYDISPLRYVFPEWTSVQHISTPRDFRAVNGAVLTGAVICVEPRFYQGSLDDPLYRDLAEYIREIERIRANLADIIFLGNYLDDYGAELLDQNGKKPSRDLHYAVHAHRGSGRLALVVVNDSSESRSYTWRFTRAAVDQVTLHIPFQQCRDIHSTEPVRIDGVGLHILVSS